MHRPEKRLRTLHSTVVFTHPHLTCGAAPAEQPSSALYFTITSRRLLAMSDSVSTTVIQAILDTLSLRNTPTTLPWRGAQHVPTKLSCGTPYQGINLLQLWAVARLSGYHSSLWGGYHAWKQVGGHVRHGEHATHLLLSTTDRRDNAGLGAQQSRCRHTPVFNHDQVDGLPLALDPAATQLREPPAVADFMDDYAAFAGVTVRHNGARAFYTPVTDTVTVPRRESFVGTATASPDLVYAGTVATGCIHHTGHITRLNRFNGTPHFADRPIDAFIAELGAAFLCTVLGFPYAGLTISDKFLAYWINALNADSRILFQCVGHATQAVDWLQQQHAP